MSHWLIGHMSVTKRPLSQKTSNKTPALVLKWNQCGGKKNSLPPCTPGSGSAQTWRTHWRIHPHPAAVSSWPSWVPEERWKNCQDDRTNRCFCSIMAQNGVKESEWITFSIQNTNKSHIFFISYWWLIHPSYHFGSLIMHNYFGEITLIILKSARNIVHFITFKIRVVS